MEVCNVLDVCITNDHGIDLGLPSCSLRNSQSQWIVGAFTSHQSTATCKTNKKTTVVFRRPSDGKVNSFFGD